MRFSLRNYAAAFAAGAGLLAACSGAQGANLIQNGGFEEPDVGGYLIVPAGGAFTGWSVVGAGNVAPIDTGFPAFGAILNAQAGSQWIDMTGATTTGAGIQQQVATTVGQLYKLSFWVGNVAAGPTAGSSTIRVQVNGAEIFAATNSDLAPGAMVWKQYATTFTATTGATTLSFFNGDSSGDDNNGLDSISLEAAAAPEPASWALMILGFGGAGAMMRRRRATA